MAASETVLRLTRDSVVVFDLDDTLYAEDDFVRSGFRQVAEALQGAVDFDAFPLFESLLDAGQPAVLDAFFAQHPIPSPTKEELLTVYRDHLPQISLPAASADLLGKLAALKVTMGLLTDGRSITQRNKIRALGIEKYFPQIVVSEEIGSMKPDRRNFVFFEEALPNCKFVYVGDNLRKDFVTPNELGWQTIGLRDAGRNVHSQDVSLPAEYYPQSFVDSLAEIRLEIGEGLDAAGGPGVD